MNIFRSRLLEFGLRSFHYCRARFFFLGSAPHTVAGGVFIWRTVLPWLRTLASVAVIFVFGANYSICLRRSIFVIWFNSWNFSDDSTVHYGLWILLRLFRLPPSCVELVLGFDFEKNRKMTVSLYLMQSWLPFRYKIERMIDRQKGHKEDNIKLQL